SLVRKYGRNLTDVAQYRDRAKEKLSRIENAKLRMEKIDEEIAGERDEMRKLSASLSEGRAKAASLLERAVMKELKEIELGGARFGVSVTQPKAGEFTEGGRDVYGPSGIDKVEFLFCPAGGKSLKPLRRIASGGEMSRVMLALKIVLDRADRIPVLVFDEVDSGVGGKTASKVGEKLARLAGSHQVFCITHLPQLAVYADRQYRVAKLRMGRGIKTVVEALDWDGRVAELCRMFGDSEEKEVTEKHARDMLERAHTRKQADYC
ncbi:MAG: DNA repair protein RecN, partial [Actinomycetota bacterium]|nr:DNA repair protein RecN [Actinomycetota bacterium]